MPAPGRLHSQPHAAILQAWWLCTSLVVGLYDHFMAFLYRVRLAYRHQISEIQYVRDIADIRRTREGNRQTIMFS